MRCVILTCAPTWIRTWSQRYLYSWNYSCFPCACRDPDRWLENGELFFLTRRSFPRALYLRVPMVHLFKPEPEMASQELVQAREALDPESTWLASSTDVNRFLVNKNVPGPGGPSHVQAWHFTPAEASNPASTGMAGAFSAALVPRWVSDLSCHLAHLYSESSFEVFHSSSQVFRQTQVRILMVHSSEPRGMQNKAGPGEQTASQKMTFLTGPKFLSRLCTQFLKFVTNYCFLLFFSFSS
jgi:hypothetical protein